MSGSLTDAAGAIGTIMACVGAGLAALAIVANEYFKRRGLPDDDGDE